ncbi:MAG: hypothetical protein ACK41P_01170 [Asticcacaulis sp.]
MSRAHPAPATHRTGPYDRTGVGARATPMQRLMATGLGLTLPGGALLALVLLSPVRLPDLTFADSPAQIDVTFLEMSRPAEPEAAPAPTSEPAPAAPAAIPVPIQTPARVSRRREAVPEAMAAPEAAPSHAGVTALPSGPSRGINWHADPTLGQAARSTLRGTTGCVHRDHVPLSAREKAACDQRMASLGADQPEINPIRDQMRKQEKLAEAERRREALIGPRPSCEGTRNLEKTCITDAVIPIVGVKF